MKLADVGVVTREGVVMAVLSGEIDMSNAAEIGSAITDATPNDARGVAIDMSGVQYADSSGIHLIFELRERLRARGIELKVVIPPGSAVSDALRLAGIPRLIDVIETLPEALESFGRS